MSFFHSMYVLLIGIAKASVKGGRSKSLFTFLFSSVILVSSIWVMFRFTTIHTAKHILFLSHPMSVDTAANHYMKVDLLIKSTEGYTLKPRKLDPYVYETELGITQLNKIVPQKTKYPICRDVKCLNYYLNDSIITYKDSMYSKYIPLNNIGNLIAFSHAYNSDFTENNDEVPYHTIGLSKEKDLPPILAYIFNNDPSCLKLPLGTQLQEKLIDVSFPGKINVDWYYVITNNDNEKVLFKRESIKNNHSKFYKGLFKLHDISKSYYEFYIFTKAIDELNITFEATEIVEISNAFADSKIGNNSISFNIKGDHYSNIKGIAGSQKVAFYTKNLESENAQIVRMFFMMTICSFSLGFLLKSISHYIWHIIRKIQKR